MIASTADKEKNRLDTGTLGWTDTHNQADYSATHSGGSFSTGGPVGKELLTNMAGGMLSGANNSGHAEGTTKAAVSEGVLIIRDADKQQQDVAQLHRDTEHANDGSISPIFNKEKEQNRLKQAQLIGEIGGQAMDIAATQGKINGEKAKKDPAALQAAKELLADNGNLNPTEKQIAEQAYNTAMAPYGTGGKVQQAMQAATAAVQGLAGGNITQAITGAAAPYLAEVIHNMTTDPATGHVNVQANLMAHAVLGAVVAQASGNSALAGASGAAAGEFIAQQLYPGIPKEQLSEEQKQTISALGTLAAGLAGGVAGGSTANAVAGAQAGKNSIENNALSPGDFGKGMADYGQSVASYAQYAQEKSLPPEQVQADLARMVKGDLPESADIIKAILSNNPGSDTVMALLDAKDAKDYALALLTSIPAEKALSLVGKATGVISNKILISAAEKISTAKLGQQFTAPRDLNEQILWNQIKENPTVGKSLPGMNNDPRFPVSAGFQKMEAKQKLADGSTITVHYQFNATTGKAYDMKITTPQRVQSDPQNVINSIKDKVK
ncbi:Putative hemolysin [Erwinia tasmaniensis Et1/99]|uniref:Hemolysin n=1 Tax=Erwinia tasmaniensis (strain DSM 17950 / CFBP 7177 / CIP 109463 / NCPPB 4357 / Et1/99) TaxID=465817 RepID=B2VIC3_ERWT9|nr:Putative hemolysin [Erwinia tasmaniensis Et1/99]